MLFILSLLLISAVAVAAHNITLSDSFKRGAGSKFSNYFAGQGACGWVNSDSEFVVALTTLEWNNGVNCGKEIAISWQGKSTTAKIVDECMDCPMDGLDFSQSLFSFFVGEGNNVQVGIIYGDWSYVSGGGGSDESTTTSTKIAPTTTSTQKKTTASTRTSTTSTTTSSTTSEAASKSVAASTSDPTSTFASAPASAPASAKSSATPVSTPLATGPQNFGSFSQAVLNLAGLIVDAQGAN
ncbi:RlpA-like double-psi beta-barrel-protein domain-containing protein-containing protein [Mycena rosella]|uniref:RlpA-like double-psi beta-barrel-protein domain-containing protein-containing protein n=1 Tax=Mycena rosella TaxID=1033263 RepID=A0AAD7DEK2_MYCRO|nr:RlpA-like double-psi beta-barrel-protein domain-containing protein-containing protein [Mycena rosella]